jgi:transposase-like protein
MNKQMKTSGYLLEFLDILGETCCRQSLIKLMTSCSCPYCGKSIADRHLKRFYSGKESYCVNCNGRFFAVGTTVLKQSKLSYRQRVKLLIMIDLNFRTKDICEEVRVSSPTVVRWREKLHKFQKERANE